MPLDGHAGSGQSRRRAGWMLGLVVGLLLAGFQARWLPVMADHVEPVVVAGNASCPQDMFALEIDRSELANRPFTSADRRLTVVITSFAGGADNDFNFSVLTTQTDPAVGGVDAVIVRGDGRANVFQFEPEALGDVGLSAPVDPATGQPLPISAVLFCFDRDLATPMPTATVSAIQPTATPVALPTSTPVPPSPTPQPGVVAQASPTPMAGRQLPEPAGAKEPGTLPSAGSGSETGGLIALLGWLAMLGGAVVGLRRFTVR